MKLLDSFGMNPRTVRFFLLEKGLDLNRTEIDILEGENFRCLPEAAEGLKAVARDGMVWLNCVLGNRTWLAGDRFTIADICLYCYMDQLQAAGQEAQQEANNLRAWCDRVAERPASEASVWREQPMGMSG